MVDRVRVRLAAQAQETAICYYRLATLLMQKARELETLRNAQHCEAIDKAIFNKAIKCGKLLDQLVKDCNIAEVGSGSKKTEGISGN